VPVLPPEAPSIHVLRHLVEDVEKYGGDYECVTAWLDYLEKAEADPVAVAKLAHETLASTGLPFETMLVLSTAHVSEATAKTLGNDEMPVSGYDHGKHGWLIVVPTDDEAWEKIAVDNINSEVPDDLFECMAHARKLGCCWLLLDADATEIEALKTYQW
jgi:hypothetical protein